MGFPLSVAAPRQKGWRNGCRGVALGGGLKGHKPRFAHLEMMAWGFLPKTVKKALMGARGRGGWGGGRGARWRCRLSGEKSNGEQATSKGRASRRGVICKKSCPPGKARRIPPKSNPRPRRPINRGGGFVMQLIRALARDFGRGRGWTKGGLSLVKAPWKQNNYSRGRCSVCSPTFLP
ncbi:hypothetical protein GQ53DRAFT_412318 [Thozetella sp. PMI_491]|nr:hypothetical protein GQ53DRAFT_412318 [Thozetella sp. PMI_491]